MKYLYIFLLFCCLTVKLFGQHAYGTTGLLFAPTAEMQKDKTIMIGGSMIDHHPIAVIIGKVQGNTLLIPIITT